MLLTRIKAFAIVLAASVVAMTTVPLFAAPSHEVCHAMQHDCAQIDALASCCCGDASDAHPSWAASDRTIAGIDSAHSVAIVPVTLGLPAFVAVFVRESRLPLTRAHDFPILFGDLRL